MPTRSTKLGSAHPAAGVNTVLFTVPAGYTYLIKDVLSLNNGGVNDTIYAQLSNAAGDLGPLIQGSIVGPAARFEWAGWVAANPGDKLTVVSIQGTSHFWVSGTVLPGVA